MLRTYRVKIETDKQSRQICVCLPNLHKVADFGGTVEEALRNLKRMAEFAIECMQKDGEPIPQSDPQVDGGLYLSVRLKKHPTGTLRAIIRQAGLTVEEFNEL